MILKKSVLTFDIGGTKISSAIINKSGSLINYTKKLLPKDCTPTEFKKLLNQLGDEVSTGQTFSVIGIASAGPLDTQKGILLKPTNLFKKQNHGGRVDLKKSLEKHFHCNTYFENDADAQALGEIWKGDLKYKKNFILISLGTGVGISVVCDGKLLNVGQNLHPEFSHMPINAFEKSKKCGCGSYGCIEAYLGGSHFVKNISKILNDSSLDGSKIISLAEAGNKKVLKAFEEYAFHMALSLRTLIMLFQPETIVFCGSFSKSYPYFAKRTLSLLKKNFKNSSGFYKVPKFTISSHQEQMALFGAAYSVFLKSSKKN